MSTDRSRRIDHDTAERLLAGRAVGHEALAGLLSAAAAPAADGELAGEQAALAAFRAARLAPVPRPAPVPRRMFTSASAKVLSVKVAAAAAVALGGVAVAAGTGHLPAALGGGPDDDRRARAEAPVTLSSPVPPSAAGRTAAPLSADLVELCRAYGRARDAQDGEVPSEPRFTVLVEAAGGPDNIEEYCAPALEAAGSPGTAPGPTDAAPGPTDRPSDARPSGRPTSRPQPQDNRPQDNRSQGNRPPDNRPTAPGTSRTPHGPDSRPTGPSGGGPGVAPRTGGDPTVRPKG